MHSVTIYFSDKADAENFAKLARQASNTANRLGPLMQDVLAKAGEVDGPNSTDPEYIEDPAELRRFLAAAANPCTKPSRQPSNT